jgi:hypothetical protein
MEGISFVGDFAKAKEGRTRVGWSANGQHFTADIQLKERANGRWRIVELRLKNPTPAALRSLSLTRVELAANALDVIRDARGATRFQLKRPQRRRLPDDFYERVARAYREAVAAGLNPRKTLATDSGVPADTVARWIGEARKRGQLPPASAGKVSAV